MAVHPREVESLPGIPVIDPHLNLEFRDLRRAIWAVNKAPELAYVLRNRHTRLLDCADLNPKDLPLVKIAGGWAVKQETREAWWNMERILVSSCEALRASTRGHPASKFPFDAHWPLPSETGYKDIYRSYQHARIALWKSRDALLILAARFSLFVALTNMLPPTTPPRWEQVLHAAGMPSVWLNAFRDSDISRFSPGMRLGAFINPGEGELCTAWVGHVPCMIQADLPVYIYWPQSRNIAPQDTWNAIKKLYPFLSEYQPDLHNAVTIYFGEDSPGLRVPLHFRWTDHEMRFEHPQSSYRSHSPPPPPLESLPHGPGQRPGETVAEFFARRQRSNDIRVKIGRAHV